MGAARGYRKRLPKTPKEGVFCGHTNRSWQGNNCFVHFFYNFLIVKVFYKLSTDKNIKKLIIKFNVYYY